MDELELSLSVEGVASRQQHERLAMWKAKKFPLLTPEKDRVAYKMMGKERYACAKEDKFDELFVLLEQQVASDNLNELVSIIYEQVSPTGNSLLHEAAGFGSNGVTELLAHHFPLLISMTNFQGDNPLHLAARTGKLSAIQILVRYYTQGGSLLAMSNEKGNTALHEAVIKGHYEVARFLVLAEPEMCNYANKNGKSPLYLAVETGNVNGLDLLLDATPREGDSLTMPEGKSPAHAAVRRKNINIMRNIAEKRPELMHITDEEGGNPLHFSASISYLEGVSFLSQKFPELSLQRNKEGDLPIHVACQNEEMKIVKELMGQWPDAAAFINGKGQNILHVAAENGQAQLVNFILSDPKLARLQNEKDQDENTPLHLATKYSVWQVVHALASDKVALEETNSENMTAYDLARNALTVEEEGKHSETATSDAKDGHPKPQQVIYGKKRDRVFRTSHEKMMILTVLSSKLHRKFGSPIQQNRAATASREEMSQWISNLLVAAVLVAGVTYAGSIQLPNIGNPSDVCSANDTDCSTLEIYLVWLLEYYIFFNTMAFNVSVMAAVILCWIQLRDVKLAPLVISVASRMVALSIYLTLVAFVFAATISLIHTDPFAIKTMMAISVPILILITVQTILVVIWLFTSSEHVGTLYSLFLCHPRICLACQKLKIVCAFFNRKKQEKF